MGACLPPFLSPATGGTHPALGAQDMVTGDLVVFSALPSPLQGRLLTIHICKSAPTGLFLWLDCANQHKEKLELENTSRWK